MSGSAIENEFAKLASQLHDIIDLCTRLKQENKALQEQQTSLVEERAKLIEKNEMARAKVEQMISRLKAMEASQ
jgi:cell division protein ZapB